MILIKTLTGLKQIRSCLLHLQFLHTNLTMYEKNHIPSHVLHLQAMDHQYPDQCSCLVSQRFAKSQSVAWAFVRAWRCPHAYWALQVKQAVSLTCLQTDGSGAEAFFSNVFVSWLQQKFIHTVDDIDKDADQWGAGEILHIYK